MKNKFTFTSVKDIIQDVFGDNLPIRGGMGNSMENAIIIERTNPINDYVSIEYHVLRYIALGRCYHSCDILKQQLLFQNGKTFDKIDVKIISNENGQMIRGVETFYFDISECYGPEKNQSDEDKKLAEMKLFLDNLNEIIGKE